MSNASLDPLFNLQTIPSFGPSGQPPKEPITALSIETARPITLTQDAASAGKGNFVYVAPTADLTIFADELTISGTITCPGRKIIVFARVLLAVDDSQSPAAISVDGGPLPDPKPKALPKGASPDGIKVKMTKGQPGWSAREHPGEMNGEDGRTGDSGNNGGDIWFCCQQTDFAGAKEHRLLLTANGGPGGEGQKGQDGADGGDGKNGRGIGDFGISQPENGTNGGDGGSGGRGGKGGQGGHGGQVTFHCIQAQPMLSIRIDGGTQGTPGKGGELGNKGRKGLGGRGGQTFSTSGGGAFSSAPITTVAAGHDGHDGKDGVRGDDGPPADASARGEQSLSWGAVANAELIKIASITQLQMLFECTRADYLVTEPPNYRLRLTVGPGKPSDTAGSGKNLVVITLAGDGLRIRIFDSDGEQLTDKNEAGLIRDLRRFQLTMADVLEAGNWLSREQLATTSSQTQRESLVQELSRISGFARTKINEMSDEQLAGRCAVTAFLLQMGIRDEAGLKGDLENHRNTLIVEIAAHSGYPIPTLQQLPDAQLVLIGLDANNDNKFVLRGGMALLRERLAGTEKLIPIKERFARSAADVLRAAGWRKPEVLKNMPPGEQRQALVDELSRISSLAKEQMAKLSDYDLVGHGSVIALLLRLGIRDEAGLKGDFEGNRNTLIVETAGNTGYEVGFLQSLDNQKLVRVALEPVDSNLFKPGAGLAALRECLYSITAEQEQEIILRAADAANCTDTWSSIGTRLAWLRDLLTAARDHASLNPLRELAKTILPSVWAARLSHSWLLDYYGHNSRFVPTLSLGAYQTAFHESLGLLTTIEEQRNRYFAATEGKKSQEAALNSSLESLGNGSKFLQAKIDKLTLDISATNDSINTYNEGLRGKRDGLEKLLRSWDNQVQTTFGLTASTFLNCLSQLGFANFTEPLFGEAKVLSKVGTIFSKVEGVKNASAMMLGPLGVMLDEGVSNVVDDYGQPVKKEMLLRQSDAIRGDLDLKAELVNRSDGFKSDDGSKRLVVELNKFSDLCKDFYKSLPSATEIRSALDGYITQITTRNRYVDQYNAFSQDLLDLLGEKRRLKNRETEVRSQLSAASDPGLPVMSAFMSSLFEQAKAACLTDLYLAARAYSFWALEPYSAFFDSLRAVGTITSGFLQTKQQQFTGSINKRLEEGFGSVQFVPSRNSGETAIGIVVVLTRETHPDFFDDLLSDDEAEFVLEPATYYSTTPHLFAPATAAWTGSDRPEFDRSAPNPFHGQANVRLTRVRPWMVGMRGDGNHTVLMTHGEEEQFRRSDNVPYPARSDAKTAAYVCHEPKEIKFVYDPAGLSWERKAGPTTEYVFTPGTLSGPGVASTEDGDMGFPQPGANISDSVYAPMGPFTRWQLTIPREDNAENLDLSQVTAVVIDFHIFKENFLKDKIMYTD